MVYFSIGNISIAFQSKLKYKPNITPILIIKTKRKTFHFPHEKLYMSIFSGCIQQILQHMIKKVFRLLYRIQKVGSLFVKFDTDYE